MLSSKKPIKNKASLAKALAAHMGWTQVYALSFIDSFFECIIAEMKAGFRVVLSGFGTFSFNRRKQRHLLHPITKESIILPERIMPQFTASKTLKKDIS